MITRTLIRNGLEGGTIKIIDSPDRTGPMCRIGQVTVFLGDKEDEVLSAKEYFASKGIDRVTDEVHEVIKDFLYWGETMGFDPWKGKYAYCDTYLNRHVDQAADTAKHLTERDKRLRQLQDLMEADDPMSGQYVIESLDSGFAVTQEYAFETKKEAEDCYKALCKQKPPAFIRKYYKLSF